MNKFEGVQKLILDAKVNTQLVSAGAGSGKTTVMIEKISNLILNDKVDVENLLVVTFTVLAAQEMKERLIKKLKSVIETVDDKESVLKIIEKINTASIDTIDGFASKTIKKYFYDLQINPDIQIISDATKDYYLSKAMKKTFNDYIKKSDNINLLLDLYGGNRRNLDSVEELIMSTYNNIINIEDYDKFLADCLNEYNDSIKSENVVNTYLCELVDFVGCKIIDEYSPYTLTVKTKLQTLLTSLESFNKSISFKTNLANLNSVETIKFSPSEYKDNGGLKELYKEINKIFEFRKNLQNNNIDENFDIKNQKIIEFFNIFLELLKNFIKNYNNIKEKNNLIDFNDLNRLMLKLLKNEKIKSELQEKYTHIFIDEYQDVNPLQDKLMSELVNEKTNLFMVGDVKQSIYGFRGSSPEWFLDKYNNLKQNNNSGNVFDMNINFRSNPKVLNFINIIFEKLMTKEIADIDYKNDCMIEPKRSDIVDDKVKIILVKDEKSEDFASGVYSVKGDKQIKSLKTKDKEALLVLKTITELISTDFYDANLKQTRKLTYSDIAILSRSDKDESAQILIDILKQNNVPLNVNNKLDITSSEGVKLILSILKCVVNTADDVDYLATFMALTELSIDDIVELRDKETSFYENLLKNIEKDGVLQGFNAINRIKTEGFKKSNKELADFILNDLKLRYYILQKPNGVNELRLIEEFMQKLSPIENALGLAEFIEVVESNVNKSGDFNTIDSEDSVTLQTIHKSKGLEYPVVILYNSSKIFSYLRDNDAINFNADIGLGVDFFDVANRIKMDSLTKFAIRLLNNKKGYKEELRLLYVALTRAKNKLFITGSYTDKIFEEISKNSFSNMILSCFIDNIQDDKLIKDDFEIELLDDVDVVDNKHCDNIKQVELVGQNFEYANRDKFNISLKNSVTGINSEKSQEKKYETKYILNKSTQYDVEDKAKVGIHYHTALEKLDFSNIYTKTTDFEDVDYKKIKLAHEKISVLTKNAINIKHEAEFMMYVPYNQIVESEITDKVLVQGVVDLIIEQENSVIIVDYKFSTLPANVLKEKYAEQLKLYKLAVENAYKKPVEHMYIYSINSGELV